MKVVQVPKIIQEKQRRLNENFVIATVSRVTIVPLSDKMQIKYLDTCSYPGETVARETQEQNERSMKSVDWSQHSCLVFQKKDWLLYLAPWVSASLPEPLTETLVALFHPTNFFLFVLSISKAPLWNLFNCLLATVKPASHNFLRKTREYSPTVGFTSKPLSYHFSKKSTTQNSIRQHLSLRGLCMLSSAFSPVPCFYAICLYLPFLFYSLPSQCVSLFFWGWGETRWHSASIKDKLTPKS